MADTHTTAGITPVTPIMEADTTADPRTDTAAIIHTAITITTPAPVIRIITDIPIGPTTIQSCFAFRSGSRELDITVARSMA